MSTFVTFDNETGNKSTSDPNRSSTPAGLHDHNLEFLDNPQTQKLSGNIEQSSKESKNKSRDDSNGDMNIPVNISASSPVIREWLSKRRQEIRPWATFANFSNFEKPNSVGKLTTRVVRNVDHFQSNYVLVFIILFLYCLLTSPLLLIVLAAAGGACYILNLKQRERPLAIAGKEINLPQQYALVGMCCIPLLLLAGAGSAFFWVIGASIFFIGLHAAFYNYDALDINDDTQKLTGSIVEDV